MHAISKSRVETTASRMRSVIHIKIMSRFFATGDTDTESSSESSDDEPRLVGAKGTTGAAIGTK